MTQKHEALEAFIKQTLLAESVMSSVKQFLSRLSLEVYLGVALTKAFEQAGHRAIKTLSNDREAKKISPLYNRTDFISYAYLFKDREAAVNNFSRAYAELKVDKNFNVDSIARDGEYYHFTAWNNSKHSLIVMVTFVGAIYTTRHYEEAEGGGIVFDCKVKTKRLK